MLTKEEQEPARAIEEEPARSESVAAPAVPELEAPEEERPHRRKGPIILVIVLVLFAAMGGGFYYCWMNYTHLFGMPMGASDKRLSI